MSYVLAWTGGLEDPSFSVFGSDELPEAMEAYEDLVEISGDDSIVSLLFVDGKELVIVDEWRK